MAEQPHNRLEDTPLPSEHGQALPVQEFQAPGELGMSRRAALGLIAAVGLSGLAVAGLSVDVKLAGLVQNRVSQGRQLLSLRDKFDALMHSLQTPEQLMAEAAAAASWPYIDMRRFTGNGPVIYHLAVTGMSTSYLGGTMADGNDAFHQPHGIFQIAYGLVDEKGLEDLQIASALVGTWSVPGAPSDKGFADDPTHRSYGINGDQQLGNPDLAAHVARFGRSVLGHVIIEGGGMNNIRNVVKSAGQFTHTVSNIQNALLGNDHVARDTEEQYERAIGDVETTAQGYGDDLITAGGRVNKMSLENIARGGRGVLLSIPGMWQILGKFVPFAMVNKDDENPLLAKLLVQDLVDLKYPDRFCLILDAIPDNLGYQFANLYYTRMRENQHRAIRALRRLHPNLLIDAPEFIGVNVDGQRFYRIVRTDGATFEWGDGHPGNDGVIDAGIIWLKNVRGGKPGQEPTSLADYVRHSGTAQQ